MVEGAALEMLYRGNSIVGSNPTLSAIFMLKFLDSSPFSSRFSPFFAVDTHNRKIKRLRKIFEYFKDYCDLVSAPIVNHTFFSKRYH